MDGTLAESLGCSLDALRLTRASDLVDLHVHTFHSGHTTIYPLSLFMKESYNSPEGVYRRAKARASKAA